MSVWLDTKDAGAGADFPSGLTEIDEGELTDCKHPALDDEDNQNTPNSSVAGGSQGQHRQPFEYGQI
jgi:hypothetical protein